MWIETRHWMFNQFYHLFDSTIILPFFLIPSLWVCLFAYFISVIRTAIV